jgi:hypothetical protein
MIRCYISAQFLTALAALFATDDRLEAHKCDCLAMGGGRS